MVIPIMKYFEFTDLPEQLQPIFAAVWDLACKMEAMLPDSTEKSIGLTILLEARDCFVKAKRKTK